MAQLAAANRALVGESLLSQGDTEHEVAPALRRAAPRSLIAADRPDAPLRARLHLREQIRQRRHRPGRARGRQPGRRRGGHRRASPTWSASRSSASRSSPRSSAASPGGSASSPATSREPPVRLVKMIGDAAMLVSPEPDAAARGGARAGRGGRGRGGRLPAAARRASRAGRRWRAAATGTGGRSTSPAGSPAFARPGSVLVATRTVKDALGRRCAFDVLVRRQAPAQGDRRRGAGSSASGADED